MELYDTVFLKEGRFGIEKHTIGYICRKSPTPTNKVQVRFRVGQIWIARQVLEVVQKGNTIILSKGTLQGQHLGAMAIFQGTDIDVNGYTKSRANGPSVKIALSNPYAIDWAWLYTIVPHKPPPVLSLWERLV